MALDKLLDLAGLPKAVLEGAQSFLNRLLGPTVDETGQLLADKVRYRRFRNQVRIVEGARRLVEDAGLVPAPVSLQTLVPLVDKASLEEDPTVQEMWSTLLANAATAKARDGCIVCALKSSLGSRPRKRSSSVTYTPDISRSGQSYSRGFTAGTQAASRSPRSS